MGPRLWPINHFLLVLHWYKLARNLSLDIVLGSCVGALFVAHYLSVDLLWAPLCCLAICIWLIYTVDHLLDAHKTKHSASSERHLFHQQYFKQLVLVCLLLAGVGAWISRQLVDLTFFMGLFLTMLVLVYFWFLKLFEHKLSYHKEIFAAFLYGSGIFLGPLSLSSQPWSLDVAVLYFQFLLIALINLLIFSMFERDIDERDQHISMVRALGKVATNRLIGALIMGGGVISSLMLFHYYHDPKVFNAQVILGIMLLTLTLIFSRENYFGLKERYRILGDAVFFYPLLLIA